MMGKNNILEIGVPRVGTLHTGDENVPQTRAVLSLTNRGVEVTLAWDEGLSNPIARWFKLGVQYADDPERKKYRYEPPFQMWFSDADGSVELLGCRVGSMKSNLFSGAMGILLFDYAILGASVGTDYRTVTGLRSTIQGLRAWVGVSSLRESSECEVRGRFSFYKSKQYTLESPEDIVVEPKKIVLHPSWSTSEADDGVSLHDLLFVESFVSNYSFWHSLEKNHQALADLLSISSWVHHDLRIDSVRRDDDGKRAEDGTPIEDKWCKVISNSQSVALLPKHVNYVIKYTDFDSWTNFECWLNLRDKYARAIDPIVSILRMQGVGFEALVLQTGVGLEALGYLLFLDDGESRKLANRHSFKERLLRVAKSLESNWIFDVHQWADNMAKAYNGIKHINREHIDSLESINAWRESVQVFRAWIALQLGIDLEEIVRRLKCDRMSHAFEKREMVEVIDFEDNQME